MAVKKIDIEEFVSKAQEHPLIDVRSPGEYLHAHIPGAHSIPLFTDEERKQVGTLYKQQSREQAIKTGVDFFGVKMRAIIEQAETIVHPPKDKKAKTTPSPSGKTILLYCWRGGMRSAGVAWLLDLYGFNVYTLKGGYKAYRNWALAQFEKDYDLRIVGGYTGSGKTPILSCLQQKGKYIIDLEGIAHHKGSAFGALGQAPQPSQEMFENILALKLYGSGMPPKENNNIAAPDIWLEDESQRIGVLNIPHKFWATMRTKPVYFLDIPFDKRLAYITKEYGQHEKEKLVNAIIRIQKRLGPLETKTAINFLLEDNVHACFEILLQYYDKQYLKGLHNRDTANTILNKIECVDVDTTVNSNKILSCTLQES